VHRGGARTARTEGPQRQRGRPSRRSSTPAEDPQKGLETVLELRVKRTDQNEQGRTDESLADCRGNCRHEEEDRHDEGTHVLGCFCEGVFESSDRSKDLAECYEDVAGYV